MTVSLSWPGHLLDLAAWDALPEDGSRRVELAEGVLLVSPRPLWRHQTLVLGLAAQLDAAAAGRWRVAPEFEVVVEDAAAATVRVPDIVVAPADLPGTTPRIAGDRLLAVVEVLSPGTRRLDRVVKLHEYADAGIPTYLVVEPGPPVELTEFALVAGAYERRGVHVGRAALALGVTLDLDALG